MSMHHRFLHATALAAAIALSGAAHAQTATTMAGSAPGAVGIVQSVDVAATIMAIDAASRVVTLKGPQGRDLSIVAGPEVKNFAQLKVGDTVNIKYAEALTLELRKGGGKPVAWTEREGAAAAKPGAMPGAVIGRQISVVGDVIAVDAAAKIVTVKGPKRTVELKVQDPEQLKLIKKGDQIEATFTEAVAVAVTPAKK